MLRLRNLICTLSVLFMIGLHVMIAKVPPPEKYPHFYWVANNAFSFAVFVMMSLYAHSKMHENFRVY